MTSMVLTLGPLRLMSILGRRKLKPSWLWLPESGKGNHRALGPKSLWAAENGGYSPRFGP
jgi:hypothetical protein